MPSHNSPLVKRMRDRLWNSAKKYPSGTQAGIVAVGAFIAYFVSDRLRRFGGI
jgi:hypothetical protein|tara:strand:+ start:3180 stop:3338 length:159 start_codon:yes stop_codon:yes gene_type:complete